MAHKTAEFDALVKRVCEEWNVPAFSLAIVKGGEIYTKSYGLANVASNGTATEDTIFNLASISKSTTAAAVACLVDDNEKYPDVQWTTPVSQLIPDDFVLADPEYTKNITIEDMLSHRTGLPTHDNSYFGVRAQFPDNAATITRNLRHLEINKPLRTTFQYCNIMFSAATHLVATLAEQEYADFLRERIWSPLGMNETYHDLPSLEGHEAAKKLVATPYRWDKEEKKYVAIPISPEPEGQGAGSIFCAPREYAKWLRALISKPSSPLSKDGWKALTTPRSILAEEEEDPEDELPFYGQALYALGLVVESYRGRKLVGHDGGVPGFTTLLRYVPELDWGVVIMTNSCSAYQAIQVVTHVLMDDAMGITSENTKDKVEWETFWHERDVRRKAKNEAEEEEEKEDWESPEDAEPLGVEMEKLAGVYYNKGYKKLVLEKKEDGKIVAGCEDRCYPFTLTFSHLDGPRLRVDLHDLSECEDTKLKGEVKVSADGQVEALGVALDVELEDMLIWFDKGV